MSSESPRLSPNHEHTELKPQKIAGWVVAAMLVILSVWWWRSDHPSPQAFTAPVSSHAGRTDALPNLGAPKSATTAVRQTTNAKSSNTVDVCGIGKVPVDGTGAEKAEAELNSRVDKDMLRWRDALLNSSDVRARAAGLFIDGRFEANSFGKAPTQQAIDSLVQLEKETNDAGVYAVALAACDNVKVSTPGSSCESISRDGWSKLEPDNAAPWLELAGKARAAKDAAAENAAFAQAARASQIQGYNWSLFGFAESDLPGDVSPYERWLMSIRMIGVQAAMYSPQMPTSAASRHCSAENLQNDATREQCKQIAELFVIKGTTVMELAIGTAIGERTGWPEARVTALKEERDAIEAAWARIQLDAAKPGGEFSCEVAMRRNSLLQERAQLGELAAARAANSLSGRTNAELAQIYREYMDKLMQGAPPMQGN
jgi:hypothetical protein